MDECEQTAHYIAEWTCYVTRGPCRRKHVSTAYSQLHRSICSDLHKYYYRKAGRYGDIPGTPSALVLMAQPVMRLLECYAFPNLS